MYQAHTDKKGRDMEEMRDGIVLEEIERQFGEMLDKLGAKFVTSEDLAEMNWQADETEAAR